MGRPVKLGLYVDPATSPPVVAVVASDTPAGRAGVRPGDVVLRIDTAVIRSENDITGALASKRPGDVVRIDLQRGQRHVTVDATLVAP
jgi:S1-C subfamily serine protease